MARAHPKARPWPSRCRAPALISTPVPTRWGAQRRLRPSRLRPSPSRRGPLRRLHLSKRSGRGRRPCVKARHTQALAELEYAADQGVAGAIWKLGRMYADGDGVSLDRARAYEYFRRLTMIYGDDSVGTPNVRYVSNAFVTLGQYYLDGIPDRLEADPHRAREMFRYAASYFADPEAQYQLGRLYLLGKGGAHKDAVQAARWLNLAADKGDHRAQALLGEMLSKGDGISRQAALGLFWLIMAKDGAGPEEEWITEMYSAALGQANESERTLAHKYLEDWLKKRRE